MMDLGKFIDQILKYTNKKDNEITNRLLGF